MNSARPSTFGQRRNFLRLAAGACLGSAFFPETPIGRTWAAEGDRKPTEFQLACMTLPYSAFPLARALEGIKTAGFEFVAWGTTHREEDGERPVMAPDASPSDAKNLADRCRDMGLAPLLMFSTIYPEHDDAPAVFENRIRQAAAAGIPQVLTFGHTAGGHRKLWIERFKRLGPIARDHGVTIVIKQHGGETGTGEACAAIAKEVDDPGVMVNYDAGNVLDYLDVDPLPDIEKCASLVRSFCIKDHRNWPRDQDCGPGFGEIDHYRLLGAVSHTGRAMPLCFENIFPPLSPRPTTAEAIDRLAHRAREYISDVVSGLQSV
jgi:sugar phosphate isomerase/epimerase